MNALTIDQFFEEYCKECPLYFCGDGVVYTCRSSDNDEHICEQDYCPTFFWFVKLHENENRMKG